MYNFPILEEITVNELTKKLTELTARLDPIESEIATAEAAFVQIQSKYFEATRELENARQRRSTLLAEIRAVAETGDTTGMAPWLQMGIDAETYQFLLSPVDNLGFTRRTAKCLEAEQISYVGDLASRNETTLIKIKNLGRKSLNEIKEVLEAKGLTIGMDFKGLWPPAGLKKTETSES